MCIRDRPYVSHETGQWCAFPNFNEIRKYTGVNKAKNFEIFKDILADNPVSYTHLLLWGRKPASFIDKSFTAPGSLSDLTNSLSLIHILPGFYFIFCEYKVEIKKGSNE